MKISRVFPGRLAALAAFTLLFSSCDKLKDLLKANVTLEAGDVSFIIPAQPAGTQTLAEFDVYLNVDSLIKANASSFDISNIRSVKVKSCQLVVLNSTANDHFGVLSTCKAELASNGNSTWTTMAELASNPDATATTLDLPVNSDVELKDYFKATTLSYKISGTTRRATTTALICKAIVKFDAEVGK
jgi:hypothetical protein